MAYLLKPKGWHRDVLRPVVGYAVFSALWILVSDRVVGWTVTDRELAVQVNTFKGWFFVAVTSLLLWSLLRQSWGRSLGRLSDRVRALELLESIAECSDDAIFAKDREGRYLFLNRAGGRFVGKAPSEILGRDDRALFPPEQAESIIAFERTVMEGDRSLSSEKVLDTPGGRRVFFGTKGPLHDDEGSVFGVFGVSRDITERKLSEEALRESESRFRGVFDGTPVPIVVGDFCELKRELEKRRAEHGGALRRWFLEHPEDVARLASVVRVVDVNAPCVAFLGAASKDDVRENLARYIDERALGWFREELVALAGGTSFFTTEMQIRGVNGGEKHVLLSAHVPEDHREALDLVYVSLVDITERKRAEEERKGLEAGLRQAQKMEAVGTLAGGIAHDFNNILTPVMAHAELALMQLDAEHPVREDVSQLLVAAERARDLVRQLLLMTRREADGPTVPVHLGALVKEVAKFLRASLPSTIEIRVEVDPGCGLVAGDLPQLHQVLLNLCTNAGYAMQEKGGTLTVSLGRAADEQGRRWVRLRVSDTGEGIPPGVQSRIFEPYFTTKPSGKGSGLGLAVVHGIVTKFDGTIRVESAPGAGATFEVLFPETSRPEAPPERMRREVPRGAGEHVLVVDDEEAIRSVVKRILASLGYRVTTCGSGAEALAAVRAAPEEFDAVFTDYTMPGMNGLDLAAELLRLRPGLPVVLGTGFAEAVDDGVVLERGLRGLVMKPYDTKRLGEALRAALLKGG